MYAVIETGGMQFTVEENTHIKVPQLDGSIGDKITIDKVLLISDDEDPKVGNPYVENANVEAKVLAHDKGEKILVYKYKRRTKYRRSQGHRQDYTKLEITKINSPA